MFLFVYDFRVHLYSWKQITTLYLRICNWAAIFDWYELLCFTIGVKKAINNKRHGKIFQIISTKPVNVLYIQSVLSLYQSVRINPCQYYTSHTLKFSPELELTTKLLYMLDRLSCYQINNPAVIYEREFSVDFLNIIR